MFLYQLQNNKAVYSTKTVSQITNAHEKSRIQIFPTFYYQLLWLYDYIIDTV